MGRGHKKEYAFECAECGADDTVPFEPRGQLKCSYCMRVEREERAERAPRRRHNTRVSVPIECTQCGAEEVLDYVPRGKKLNELMCTKCTEEELGGDSRWKQVRREKAHEERSSWEVACAECRVPIYLNAKPWPGRDYICQACKIGAVPAGQDARRGTPEAVQGGLLRRRSRRPNALEEE